MPILHSVRISSSHSANLWDISADFLLKQFYLLCHLASKCHLCRSCSIPSSVLAELAPGGISCHFPVHSLNFLCFCKMRYPRSISANSRQSPSRSDNGRYSNTRSQSRSNQQDEGRSDRTPCSGNRLCSLVFLQKYLGEDWLEKCREIVQHGRPSFTTNDSQSGWRSMIRTTFHYVGIEAADKDGWLNLQKDVFPWLQDHWHLICKRESTWSMDIVVIFYNICNSLQIFHDRIIIQLLKYLVWRDMDRACGW